MSLSDQKEIFKGIVHAKGYNKNLKQNLRLIVENGGDFKGLVDLEKLKIDDDNVNYFTSQFNKLNLDN